MSDLILLPVFNEESTVDYVLDSIRRHFTGDLLVVDDGSSDGTVAALAKRDDVSVLTNPRNLGYGRALAEGFALARSRGYRRVVTMDCDGQHEPMHIVRFLAVLDEGWDIVSGSRYLPESAELGIAAPGQRVEVNRWVTEEINRVTGWGLTDAFCGFKAYRLSALDRMDLREPGYGMPVELWAKAHRAGLRVTERAVERIYCDHSRSFGDALDDARVRFAYYMDVWKRALADEEEISE